jgi:spermidine synthase
VYLWDLTGMLFRKKGSILSRIFVAKPQFTVFFVNFCIMTLELVAGRMIAPYVGVSLYTWTAVIGVVLFGMTIGNFYGGKLADEQPKKEIVGILLGGAGVFSLVTIMLVQLFGQSIGGMGIPYLIQVLLITVVFLLPSIMLGAVTPVIVKLSLKSLKQTGRIVGRIYAMAALGSIVGTYVTGFWLIAAVGVRMIVVVVSLILFLIALAFVDFRRFFSMKNLFLITLFFLGVVSSIVFSDYCFKESNYYCIKINFNEESGVKSLLLDKLQHSYTDMNNPKNIIYGYEKLFAVLYEYFAEDSRNSLFLGGGGYTLPRYLVDAYSKPKATVVEIDPLVSQVAFAEFDMPEKSSINSVNVDARMFVKNLDGKVQYDLVFGDAFSDFSIPYHLTTHEFNQLIKKHLREEGYYVSNVIDQLNTARFLRSFVRTQRQSFDYVYLFEPERKEELKDGRWTFVVVAGEKKLDMDKLKIAASKLGFDYSVLERFSEDELKKFLNNGEREIILTDDFVPADNLIAPVYADSAITFNISLSRLWENLKFNFNSLFKII